MSARNMFVINTIGDKDNKLYDNLYKELSKIAKIYNVGLHYNVRNYHNELIEKLNVKNYFFISDSVDTIETDSLFSTTDSFDAIKNLEIKSYSLKEIEKKFLMNKFRFLNKIIEIILCNFLNIYSIVFYVSAQYVYELSDYTEVLVENNDLTSAFVNSFKPTKKNNYYGLKTAKFVINL